MSTGRVLQRLKELALCRHGSEEGLDARRILGVGSLGAERADLGRSDEPDSSGGRGKLGDFRKQFPPAEVEGLPDFLDPSFGPQGGVELLQLFLRVAVRVDRNGESTVAVEFGGARGTLVPEPFAVPQNRAVKVSKGKLILVLVEELFRFCLLFDEPEQSVGVG
uniref:hypothetical protein n=1 Tax=Cupriavidus taiwanensis TaxID=164546 RepID=UPI0013312571|nr:hypothetical protein [Cupriavidus taiwanensis]